MLKKYEEKVTEWLEKVGWKENPFSLKILASLWVGRHSETQELIYSLEEGQKFLFVEGKTGSGKTTLLKLLDQQLDGFAKIYFSKPLEPKELLKIFLDKFKPSFWQRLRGINVRLSNLPEYMNKKLGNEKLLLLIDEAHEAPNATLGWYRTLTDQIDQLQLVLAALPKADKKLNQLHTLKSRITTKIKLQPLEEGETRKLIRKRIKWAGGDGVAPFTESCLNEIYKESKGQPRKILKICDKLVGYAIKEGRFSIEQLKGVEPEKRMKRDLFRKLPYKQKKIVKLLAKEEYLIPSEIVELIGLKGYKSKQHAVRSINNILRRLLKDGYVKRERAGRSYAYSLKSAYKELLSIE